jgi:predicted DNA-binding transcriptional regulator AlpA
MTRARHTPRRLLRLEEAAEYCGLGRTKFEELVAASRMPQPLRIDSCVRWDVLRLDEAIDAMSDHANARWAEPVA